MAGKVLVTGGRGRLAAALAALGGVHVVAQGRADLDIGRVADIERALASLRPAAVINTAATSSVEAAETDPDSAFAVNAAAPGLLAQACAAAGIPLVHISTDYVFGSETNRPWRENDPVSPINAYGEGKAEGERRVLAAGGSACVVRVAWLFGDGKDFVSGLLGRGDIVRVADDQIGSPTPIYPLASRLIQLAERMAAREAGLPKILHLAGGPPVARADWAQAMFDRLRAAGAATPRIVRAPMESFPSVAARPRFSALDNARSAEIFGSLLDWRSGQ